MLFIFQPLCGFVICSTELTPKSQLLLVGATESFFETGLILNVESKISNSLYQTPPVW